MICGLLFQTIKALESLKFCNISWDFTVIFLHLRSKAVYNSSAKYYLSSAVSTKFKVSLFYGSISAINSHMSFFCVVDYSGYGIPQIFIRSNYVFLCCSKKMKLNQHSRHSPCKYGILTVLHVILLPEIMWQVSEF